MILRRENVSWGVEVHKGAAVELKHCHVVENRSRLQGMTGGVYVWGEGASATTGAGKDGAAG